MGSLGRVWIRARVRVWACLSGALRLPPVAAATARSSWATVAVNHRSSSPVSARYCSSPPFHFAPLPRKCRSAALVFLPIRRRCCLQGHHRCSPALWFARSLPGSRIWGCEEMRGKEEKSRHRGGSGMRCEMRAPSPLSSFIIFFLFILKQIVLF